jgi:saccharopine dehydrogenase-like NADP-dependent oxidoreductase
MKLPKIVLLTKKHMVTASYVSDAMQKLDSCKKKSNLTFMNSGLDPELKNTYGATEGY